MFSGSNTVRYYVLACYNVGLATQVSESTVGIVTEKFKIVNIFLRNLLLVQPLLIKSMTTNYENSMVGVKNYLE